MTKLGLTASGTFDLLKAAAKKKVSSNDLYVQTNLITFKQILNQGAIAEDHWMSRF